MKYLAITLAVLLSACSPRTGDVNPDFIDPVLYVDRVTGCNYLSTGETKSLTPRIAADGHSHMGCKDGR
jgi:hypothetical protein